MNVRLSFNYHLNAMIAFTAPPLTKGLGKFFLPCKILLYPLFCKGGDNRYSSWSPAGACRQIHLLGEGMTGIHFYGVCIPDDCSADFSCTKLPGCASIIFFSFIYRRASSALVKCPIIILYHTPRPLRSTLST